MQRLREDVYQYAELLSAGFRLSFPAVYHEAQFFATFTRSVRDVIISQLYPSVILMYRKKLVDKDEQMKSQCTLLRSAPPEVSGVDRRFASVVSTPVGMEPSTTSGKAFAESASVRQKLHHLESLSSSLFSLAAQQLKQLAMEKKKKTSAPDVIDTKSSFVEDVLKYSIGADDFLPLLTYALIQMDLPFFYSDLLFVADFIDESMLLGKAGYLLASAQTAIQYIVSLAYDPKSSTSSAQAIATEDDSGKPAVVAVEKAAGGESVASPSPNPSRKSFFGSKRNSSPKSDSVSTHSSGSKASPFTPPRDTPPTPPRMTASVEMSAPDAIVPHDKESWVLNTFSLHRGEPLEGETAYHYSQRLYSLIISIYHRFNKNSPQAPPGNKKSAAVETRMSVRSDEIYATFRMETTKLQSVSIESLSGKEKMIFFLNVYHALVLHGAIEREWPDSDLSRLRIYQRLAYSAYSFNFLPSHPF